MREMSASMVLRMQVLSAVHDRRNINEKNYAHLELFLKPVRKVQSTKAWQKNALQLYKTPAPTGLSSRWWTMGAKT